MCGIIGYVGPKKSVDVLVRGLKKLEYRGYDSSGVAAICDGEIKIIKKAGPVSNLEKILSGGSFDINVGIGHTRWATHGRVNDINSHPHISYTNRMAIVHNGIIENFNEFKNVLIQNDIPLKSETDSEILLNYIEYIKKTRDISLADAIKQTITQVKGSCTALIFSKDEDKILVIRKDSPMVLGITEDEIYLASDITPLIGHTDKFIFLENNTITSIKNNQIDTTNFEGKSIKNKIETLDLTSTETEKGDFEHYMAKEIYEQPFSMSNCLDQRLSNTDPFFIYPELSEINFKIIDRIILLGCGGSYHAALYGKYLLEEILDIPISVEISSEFAYKRTFLSQNTLIVAISQSGETADTISALQLVKHLKSIAICNVPNSTITRMTTASIMTKSGPEISVASTKAFTTQMVSMVLLTYYIHCQRSSLEKDQKDIIKDLLLLPGQIKNLIEEQLQYLKISKSNINEISPKYNPYQEIATKLMKEESVFYLGRGLNYPIALEGALKLKEIAYIHAEGYPASEMKHGPLALIHEKFPVIFFSTDPKFEKKNISNILELTTRGASVSVIVTSKKEFINVTDNIIEVPKTHYLLQPIINTIPIQLLSYYTARLKKCDIDKPKNLAKSVTVE